jgi:hypothetical protein
MLRRGPVAGAPPLNPDVELRPVESQGMNQCDLHGTEGDEESRAVSEQDVRRQAIIVFSDGRRPRRG